MSSPLVLILDVDGTLVGDVTNQVMLYDIARKMKQSKARINYSAKDMKDYIQTTAIIRPHFKCFFDATKETNIEIFIYTAAEKTWAEYIIKHIEASMNIKFNRPLFTRSNCVNYNGEFKKSIKHITPAILKALKRKPAYKHLKSLSNAVMAIDNTPIFIEQDAQLLCTTYSVAPPVNIPRHITREAWEKNYKLINDVVSSYHSTYKPTSSLFKFEKQYYTTYNDNIASYLRQRQLSSNDPLFKVLQDILVDGNVKILSAKNIQYISKKYVKENNKANELRKSTFF